MQKDGDEIAEEVRKVNGEFYGACYDKVFNGANSNMNHGFNNNHNPE
jgi:hypothetical protein